MTDPRYPIGKFTWEENFSDERRRELIAQIAEAPAKLRAAVKGLDDKQLGTAYREGGWTLRQVAHHLPESHMNAYIRFKLALTEDFPTIKPYDQELWAKTPDTKAPIDASVSLLESLHTRWVTLLKSLSAADFKRKLNHPEWGAVSLEQVLAQYAWHGRHHVAHITSLRERMGWK